MSLLQCMVIPICVLVFILVQMQQTRGFASSHWHAQSQNNVIAKHDEIKYAGHHLTNAKSLRIDVAGSLSRVDRYAEALRDYMVNAFRV